MSNDHPQADTIASQAIFTVCVASPVAASIVAATQEVHNSRFVGEFHQYFNTGVRPQFPTAVKTAQGCVAVVDCERDPELALDTMKRLRTMYLNNLSIIGTASQMDAGYLVRAMRSGCNEFFTNPIDHASLRDTLQSLQQLYVSGETTETHKGHILSFFGIKGGVGTTSLAVHVANTLARRHQKRTLLIDHHHELGHAALYLGIKEAPYHFDELLKNADKLDRDLLSGLVTRCPGGLDILASPPTCFAARAENASSVENIMAFLRTQYDHVLVDSSLSQQQLAAPILSGSDDICLVSTPDVASLRDLARRIEHLCLLEGTSARLKVVVNRSSSEDPVSRQEIETAVQIPIWATIPECSKDVSRAMNAGTPLPPQHRSPYMQRVRLLVDQLISIAPEQAVPAVQKKHFSFWNTKRQVKTA